MSDNNFFNFNDAQEIEEAEDKNEDAKLSPDEIKAHLLDRLPTVLNFLLPEGKERNKQFIVGDINGNRGKSLVVELQGNKAGVWKDFATNEGGDIFDLWAHYQSLDVRRDFSAVLESVNNWLGYAPAPKEKPKKKTPPIDELGPATAKWDYHNKSGDLIACVYRYETENGKEYRPWDVKARKTKAPEPRPLYQQPAIDQSDYIVLVEGEKCADALIKAGITATTAMNGANAPIDKTDWSPLLNKHVLIWPDHDGPGVEYAERAAQAIASAGAASVCVLVIPESKPDKWDGYDAVNESLDIDQFIKDCKKINVRAPDPLRAFTLGELLGDDSPIPDDLIEPRILTPGGMAVLGGAPKVGKSDFILSLFTHMAAGETFLGLKPAKRLRIFYLQAEVQYHYLRERLKNMNLKEMLVWRASDNLFITPQLRLILNDEGVEKAKKLMREASENEPLDVIAVDPLRNVFDGGDEGASENDNNAMLYFLKRVESLRDAINPDAGIIIVHHTRKLNKRALMEDPFLSFSGASSLRGYYSTGMLLFKPDENISAKVLKFELRNGPGIPDKWIDKKHSQWIELEHESQRLVNQDHGERLDAERRRKRDVILQLIYDEAAQGRLYTIAQFSEAFEGKAGLGANRTIADRLSVGATKGNIKFFKDPENYGLPPLKRSKYGYLCVEGMRIPSDKETVDTETGEIKKQEIYIKPSHYKSPENGAVLPVENPDIWVYQDGENDEE